MFGWTQWTTGPDDRFSAQAQCYCESGARVQLLLSILHSILIRPLEVFPKVIAILWLYTIFVAHVSPVRYGEESERRGESREARLASMSRNLSAKSEREREWSLW